jgi:hypothetical protein
MKIEMAKSMHPGLAPLSTQVATMLARIFKMDVTTFEKCGGKLQLICAVKDPDSIRRCLTHLQLDYERPPRTPPRELQGTFEFDHAT